MTLTKNAALGLAKHRIRVNQLNVGWTLTEGEQRVKTVEEGLGPDWLDAAVKTRAVRPPAVAARHRARRGVLRLRRQRAHHRQRARPRAVPDWRARNVVTVCDSDE